MAWRKSLRPASFRGVPFGVFDIENEGGRRVVLHEVPLLDDLYVEDMGRAAHKITVQGFVLGGDYLTRAKALMDALEESGPGTLVHPYFGETTVALAGAYKCKQSAADGGIAGFAMSFVRCEAASATTAPRLNSRSIALERCSFAESVAFAGFEGAFDLAGLPAYAVQELKSAVSDALSLVAGMFAGIGGWQSVPGVDASSSSSLGTGLRAAIASLGQASGNGGTTIGANAEARAGLAYLAAAEALGTGAPSVVSSPSEAVAVYVRQCVVIEGAKSLAVASPPSRADAAVMRRALNTSVQAMLEAETTPDALYTALVDVRAATVAAIAKAAGRAPEIIRVQEVTVQPSLVIAYRHTGGLLSEGDVVSRNRIAHPGFVPVMPLEVLR